MGNHSLTCIVRLIVGGQITPQPISIQWIELDCSNKSEILADCNETVKVSGSCAANTSNTSLAHSYRCTAKYFGLSNYSDVIANQTGRLFLATSIFYVICPSSLGENITSTTSVLYSIKANTQSLTSVIIPSGKTSAVITSGSIAVTPSYITTTN